MSKAGYQLGDRVIAEGNAGESYKGVGTIEKTGDGWQIMVDGLGCWSSLISVSPFKSKFNLHDWVIEDMEIKQITKLDECGNPTELSNGIFCSSTRDFTPQLRPLTLRNKNIASYFNTLYQELHQLRQVNLNYPDLHRYFSQKCLECIDAPEDQAHTLQCEICETQKKIVEEIKKFSAIEVDGVRLLRQ